MSLSVVIPAFARVESLRSVLQAWRLCADDIELVVVDDKSLHPKAIEKLASRFQSLYVRNSGPGRERQPALCRNLGLHASSGEIVIFNDADVLPIPKAHELHARYHAKNVNVVLDSQVRSIIGGQDAVSGLRQFAVGELMAVSQLAAHGEPFASTIQTPKLSDNWWAFLSAQCSFKRGDLLRIGGWDEDYVGWGVEDNDMGYRVFRAGLRIIYAQDIPCFHIDHAMSRKEYRDKCDSALRNLRRMCKKHPEVANDRRVTERIKELENLMKSDLSLVSRQGTAGGGPIKESDI